MAIQMSTELRNARLDAIETVLGASPILKIRSGSVPANCAAADSGTVLSTINLPSDSMAAAAAAVKSKLGTWSDSAADATGNAAHWRLYKNDGTTCVMQGTCAIGSGDMPLDNTSIASGQGVTISAFDLTEAGA